MKESRGGNFMIYPSLTDIRVGAPGRVILDLIKHSKHTFQAIAFQGAESMDLKEDLPSFVKLLKPGRLARFLVNLIQSVPSRFQKNVFYTVDRNFQELYIEMMFYVLRKRPTLCVVHVSFSLTWLIKWIVPSCRMIYYHHGSNLHLKLNQRLWTRLNKVTNGTIIGVSERGILEIKRVFKVNGKRIQCIHNGIDRTCFNPENVKSESDKIREQIKLHAKTVFFFCGRISVSKGIIEVIQAFEKVRETYSDVFLLLIGGVEESDKSESHKYLASLINAHTELGSQSFLITGKMERNMVAAWMNCGDVGILASRKEYEGLSLFAIESLALGKPLIVSNMGGNREVVGDSCGLVVENDDSLADNLSKAMINLHVNKQLRDQMSLNALERSRTEFDVKIMTAKFDNYLDETLKKV